MRPGDAQGRCRRLVPGAVGMGMAVVLMLAAGGGPRGMGIPRAGAHDGPEHEIEELTDRIESHGESAELLVGRAIEFRVLGKLPESERDLERALVLDPDFLIARRELARLELSRGNWRKAEEISTRALGGRPADPVAEADLYLLRAEAFRALGEFRKALADCEAALKRHPSNPEWYLVRSELQRVLGRERARVAGLEAGLELTGSGVLGVERVEALLDARRFREALKWIEPELEASRIRCRWLIRRGRARLGLGEQAEGEADLRLALPEVEALLQGPRPDPTLILDHAHALACLGDWEEVRRCHERARNAGADAMVMARLESLLKAAPQRGNRDRVTVRPAPVRP